MRPSHASTTTLSSARAPRVRTVLNAFAACALALFVAFPSTAAATPLSAKQAQAAALDRQVSRLEDRYAGLQERYRGSLVELRELRGDVVAVQAKLDRSKQDLEAARVRLEERALAIYRDGSGNTQLLEVARAGSFSEFFDRADAIERVGKQDADILQRVDALTRRVESHERKLRESRDRKATVVRKAAAAKKRMSKTLATKQAALSSVTAEIRGIMEQQRAAEAARLASLSVQRATVIQAGGAGDSIDAGDVTPAANGAGSPAPSDGGTSSSSAAAPAPSLAPLPPSSGSASRAAGIAMGKVGSPYVYGAAGPNSFDCSGLVVWAFAQAGRPGLPHSTYSLIGMGVEVPLSQAQVGDLVFTNNTGHMGIYVGGGSFVHSPRTGRTVSVEPLTYYNVVSVRRI